MANPLKLVPPGGPSDPGDLRAICHRYNFQHSWTKHVRWYYVEPGDFEKKPRIEILSGPVADEVWTVFEGGKIDYIKWPKAKLDTIERKARWLIAQGTLRPNEIQEAAE
jgi:hypothetical protein